MEQGDLDNTGLTKNSLLHPDCVIYWPGSQNLKLQALVSDIKGSVRPQLVFALSKVDLDNVSKLVVVDTHSVSRAGVIQSISLPYILDNARIAGQVQRGQVGRLPL